MINNKDCQLTPTQARIIDEALSRHPVAIRTRELPPRPSKNEKKDEE